MKNKNPLKQILRSAAVLIALLIVSGKANAQAQCKGYTVDNKTSCTIVVDITYYCNGTVCGSTTGQNIGPYSSFLVTTGCGCNGTCDYAVTVTDIGGNTGAPLPITVISSSTGPYNWPASWGCTATYYEVLWTSTRTLIH